MSIPAKYKLIGHEFEDEAIYCKIKIHQLNKTITKSAADIYYDDDWLSGFNIQDIRAISSLVAQEDMSRSQNFINNQSDHLSLFILKKWFLSLMNSLKS